MRESPDGPDSGADSGTAALALQIDKGRSPASVTATATAGSNRRAAGRDQASAAATLAGAVRFTSHGGAGNGRITFMRSLIVALWMVLVAAMSAVVVAADDDPKSLVERLPYDRDVPTAATQSGEVESALVALGEGALDALEREMHLDLRGRDAQAFSDSGKSKRYAVIRVLGRIETDRSSRVLIDTVRAYGDHSGLCDAVVRALDSRVLNDSQIERLLRSASPPAVTFALRKAGGIDADSPLRAAAETVFNHDLARQQFRNLNGYPIGNEDTLWDVRLAAGRALGVDMVPDMRRRAYALVGDLDAAALGDLDGAGPPVKVAARPQAEIDILQAIGKLVALGAPIRDVVENTRRTAQGEFAVLLDIALLAMGDKDRVPTVASTVAESPHASLRVCAASVRRGAKDRRALPTWWRALADPFRRTRAECVRMPGADDHVYPVRTIAADALIELGEDPKAVREKERAR